jgi:hypothetical protein
MSLLLTPPLKNRYAISNKEKNEKGALFVAIEEITNIVETESDGEICNKSCFSYRKPRAITNDASNDKAAMVDII